MRAPTDKQKPVLDHRGRVRPSGEQRTRAEEVSEQLLLDATRAADPEAAGKYAHLYRLALLEALDEIGATDADALALAHSRAALRSWPLARLHPVDASAVRLGVLAEARDRLGVAPLRKGLGPGLTPTRDHGVFVPRAEEVREDRVRRGGRRR